ncbi:MAG: FAD-dependent oxidoreductase, partial [Candidatus Paceibacterota bacterium]
MKIAVLGGGLTGLTASYLLAKEGHTVVLYEKSHRLGGLAAGFKQAGWEWYVDYAYHHLFTNDHDIISFAREIEFDGIEVKKPVTASRAKLI